MPFLSLSLLLSLSPSLPPLHSLPPFFLFLTHRRVSPQIPQMEGDVCIVAITVLIHSLSRPQKLSPNKEIMALWMCDVLAYACVYVVEG